MPTNGDRGRRFVQACADNHKIPQLSGFCSVLLRCVFNFFLKSDKKKTMANTQVPAAAVPKIQEIITSLDDDKIGKYPKFLQKHFRSNLPQIFANFTTTASVIAFCNSHVQFSHVFNINNIKIYF